MNNVNLKRNYKIILKFIKLKIIINIIINSLFIRKY